MSVIDRYLDGVIKRKSLYFFSEFVIRFILAVSGLMLLLGIVDYLTPLPAASIYIFWVLAALLAGFFSAALAKKILKSAKKEKTISELQGRFGWLSDNLINAWQLEKNIGSLGKFGVSEELVNTYVEGVSEKVLRELPPANSLKKPR